MAVSLPFHLTFCWKLNNSKSSILDKEAAERQDNQNQPYRVFQKDVPYENA